MQSIFRESRLYAPGDLDNETSVQTRHVYLICNFNLKLFQCEFPQM